MRIQVYNPSKIMPTSYVALGSNQSSGFGSPKDTLLHSLKLFSEQALFIRAQSHWYCSPAFPAGNGPDYVNGVVAVESALSPLEILAALHRIEAKIGRTRHARWATRSIDLDLLACENQILPDLAKFRHWQGLDISHQKTTAPEELILPHPRLQDRGFVLIPFNDLAPEWRHPVLGKTVKEMLAALPAAEIAPVRRISAR